MHSCELVVTISATACAISKGKSPDEIALLATIFSQLGDTLATIAAQEALCAPNNRAAVTPPDTPANVTSDSSVDPSADSIANAVAYATAFAASDSAVYTSADTTPFAASNSPEEMTKDTE
ncbi:DUF6774 domain-containing protein [uncultured Robinsoniella sp.]|uniref:DUF6774 domain-containing protein n=1 Tax=Robinsoniella sp. TaxID=2496533 RepID=UPI00374EED82